MKPFKLTILITMLMSMVGVKAQAYDFRVLNADGKYIYYEKGGETEVGVTYTWPYNKYTGDITIPETVTYNGTTYNVTYIDDQAFSDCSGLTSITIPNSVKSIEKYAFRFCSALTSIIIPNSVISIGTGAFYYCSGLITVTINSNSIIKNKKVNSIFGSQVQKYIIGDEVTDIGNYAFSDCSSLSSITIPNSVTTIGEYAFNNCFSLKTVEFHCAEIGSRLFDSTTRSSIEQIILGDEVRSIGNGVFSRCSITSITIPNNVKSIGRGAFGGCSSLAYITIPNSVTCVGSGAFSETPWFNSQPDGLVYTGKVVYAYKGTMPDNTSITITEGTQGIAGQAFYKCKGLTSITIPNSVTNIGEEAFRECYYLNTLTIPENVSEIGEEAFSYCTSLTSINLPNNITYIRARTFEFCSSLTSIIIPNGVTEIGTCAFDNCSSLTLVTIGNSVVSIGDSAFERCTGLTSVTIPNSVTSIGGYAFENCEGLTLVTIPNSVTYIGEHAFYVNDTTHPILTSVVSHILEPFDLSIASFSKMTFKNATLYVPVGSKNKYKAKYGWKEFIHIVEGEPTDIINVNRETITNNRYYTLDGREVEHPTKGIYILNGKKVVVK